MLMCSGCNVSSTTRTSSANSASRPVLSDVEGSVSSRAVWAKARASGARYVGLHVATHAEGGDEDVHGTPFHSARQSRSSHARRERWSMVSQAEIQRSLMPPRQYSTAT